jgi:hypothetical protein
MASIVAQPAMSILTKWDFALSATLNWRNYKLVARQITSAIVAMN